MKYKWEHQKTIVKDFFVVELLLKMFEKIFSFSFIMPAGEKWKNEIKELRQLSRKILKLNTKYKIHKKY